MFQRFWLELQDGPFWTRWPRGTPGDAASVLFPYSRFIHSSLYYRTSIICLKSVQAQRQHPVLLLTPLLDLWTTTTGSDIIIMRTVTWSAVLTSRTHQAEMESALTRITVQHCSNWLSLAVVEMLVVIPLKGTVRQRTRFSSWGRLFFVHSDVDMLYYHTAAPTLVGVKNIPNLWGNTVFIDCLEFACVGPRVFQMPAWALHTGWFSLKVCKVWSEEYQKAHGKIGLLKTGMAEICLYSCLMGPSILITGTSIFRW